MKTKSARGCICVLFSLKNNFKKQKMSKLSLDALRLRAEAVASEDLLATISGGMENACHPGLTGNLETDSKNLGQQNPQPSVPTITVPPLPQKGIVITF